jgi:hypothetical protein
MTDDERQAAPWDQWATAIVARELEAERKLMIDVVGAALALERERMRDEFAEQLGLLRAELAVQRAAEKADVISLPALPLRKRSHAA